MKSGFVCLACLLGASSLAPAFERTIILPDSFGGQRFPFDVAVNPVLNKIYVAGEDDRIVVIDGTTHERVGVIEVPADLGVERIVCNPATGRLYGIADGGDALVVMDCRTNTVRCTLNLYPSMAAALVANQANGRVYCHVDGIGEYGGLLVIDGVTDTAVDTIVTSWPIETDYSRGLIVVDNRRNRLYCPCEDSLTDATHIDFVDCAADSVVVTVDLESDACFGLALDTAGNRLFAACYVDGCPDPSLAVIDASTGARLDTIDLGGSIDDIVDVCYSPVTDRVYCLDVSGIVVIVDPDRRLVEDLIYLAGGQGVRMELHPDGTRLYCFGDEGRFYVVDCPTRSVVADLMFNRFLTALAVNPRSGVAYVTDEECSVVHVLDREGNSVRDIWTAYRLGSGISDDRRGRLYYTNLSRNSVLVLDALTGRTIADVPVSGTPGALLLNPNHPRLYCASTSRHLTVIDFSTMAPETTLRIGRAPENLCYDRAADRLYCASRTDDVIDVIDGRTNEGIARIPAGDKPSGMCLDPQAGRLYCALSGDDSIAVVDCSTGTVVARLPVGRDPRALCFDPHRRRAYCANWGDSSITVIDADSLCMVAQVRRVGANPVLVALDTALGRLYCRTPSSIVVVDCAADSVVRRIPFDGVLAAALDRARNQLFVVQSRPRSVVALDAATGRVIRTWDGVEDASGITALEDGDRVYVTSSLSQLYVLDKPEQFRPVDNQADPTLFRAEVLLLGTRAATVHDITGRRVADFSPGRNSLSRLPAGIYFIRREGEQQTAKVVVTR
ncbi:MAG: hypothetical protein R6X13_04920 [bacterium]